MTTLEKLQEIIQRECGFAGVTAETRTESLGLDSLEFLSLMKEIESAFGIVVPDDKYATIHTVADILALL